LHLKKLAHELDPPINELEALRKSLQLNQSIIDNGYDLINQLTEQLQAKIAEQQLGESQLMASEERFRTLVEKAPLGIAIHRKGINLFVNQVYVTMHGYESDLDLIGKPVINLIAPEWRDAIGKRIKRRQKGEAEPGAYETVGLRKDGSTFPLFIQANNIMLFDGPANVSFLTDISERKQAENELVEVNAGLTNEIELRKMAQNEIELLAYFDHLTKLPNRLMLLDRLNQAIDLARRIEKPIGIMYIDLDDFKAINDTMGHQQGDELLKIVANRLVNIFRKSDTVTRLSGDEFIIMAPNLGTVDHIEKVAEKAIAAFREPFELNHQEVYVTVSIGISIFPADGQTGDELIKNADVAMYKAKDNGKNQYVLCTPIMKEIVAENMKLSNGLYRALEKNELEVYYQPQVCVSTNKIVGLEALLRWKHPELGMVPPVKFISLAEQTGLIIPIGEWVIRTVCRQSKTWQEEGIAHIRIAVNMSLVQFLNPNIADLIRGILEETNLSPQYLELEITESIAMRDTESIIKVLNGFREIGLYVSIDDFGTEYSSLMYLKLLPINRIKIPMPFIQGIDVSKKDEAIIKAIIVLARNMGMDILAEGVETQQQRDFLTKRLCDVIQGYYYYKPMPAKEIEALLKNN